MRSNCMCSMLVWRMLPFAYCALFAGRPKELQVVEFFAGPRGVTRGFSQQGLAAAAYDIEYCSRSMDILGSAGYAPEAHSSRMSFTVACQQNQKL